MNDPLHPTDNPSLAPCSYVTIESANPLPLAGTAWDDESVGSYGFPEWLDDVVCADELEDSAKAVKGGGEDCSEYTADTDNDDDISTATEFTPRSLVVLRRRSSSGSLSLSSAPPVLERARTRRQLTPALAASFFRDRVHTFTANIEVLATVNSTLGVHNNPNHPNHQGEEEESHERRNNQGQIVRVNPLARFVLARMNTFTSNVEMMSTVLAEQIEAYFAAAQEDNDDFYTYEGDW